MAALLHHHDANHLSPPGLWCTLPTMTKNSKIPGYRSWTSMLERCRSKNRHNSHRYSERGIDVCDSWKHSFAKFYADMGERPLGTSLDRIDNNKGYSPENCRWATPAEQSQNREPSNSVGRKPNHKDRAGQKINHLTFKHFTRATDDTSYWIAI